MEALLPILLQYGLKYGPQAVVDIIAFLKKKDPTVEDLEALFVRLKTYDDYINQAKTAAPGP
jgi:hypothetical protein